MDVADETSTWGRARSAAEGGSTTTSRVESNLREGVHLDESLADAATSVNQRRRALGDAALYPGVRVGLATTCGRVIK
jgi:hypothetical protein